MEKELQEYIEKMKEHTLDTKDIKKAILRIKRVLESNFECCKEEIESGELSREEILVDYLKEYEKESIEEPDFQMRLTYLMSQYEACRQIIKSSRKNKFELNSYINTAKRMEKEYPNEQLYNTINEKEELITVLRIAIRNAKVDKLKKNQNYNEISTEEILEKIFEVKSVLDNEIKDRLVKSLNKKVRFLDEYDYIEDYIEENNEALRDSGLPGIQVQRLNPIADIEYDEERNLVKREEFEDMGVVDFFRISNLKEKSVDELFVLELAWKQKYLTEKLEMAEAFSTIEFLNLWPMILNEDDSAIENIDEKDIKSALKRDLALTYLIKQKEGLSPELEEKYLEFLKKNNMVQKNTTMEEIYSQTKLLKNTYWTANDLMLGESVLLDKLRKKEINVKNWGIIEDVEFDGLDTSEDKMVIGLEMPEFRGPLLLRVDKGVFADFLETKERSQYCSKIKLPKFREYMNEDYSKALATLFLPTSIYFKKYVSERYEKNPTSPLYSKLAIDFADAKKIKVTKKPQKESRQK